MQTARLFKTHLVRSLTNLNGVWDYYFPTAGTEIEPLAWANGKKETIPVPGVWEMLPHYKNYRGQTVARKVITTEETGPARLVFKGVSHTARVFVNGKEVGFHHNAYTPFTVDVPELPAGENEILVHISNEHGEISALHIPNDYYNYGGLSRPVELHALGSAAFIEWVHVTPLRKGTEWSAKIEAKVRSLGAEKSGELKVSLAGTEQTWSDVAATADGTVVSAELACPGVTSWNPAHPELYFVEATWNEGGTVIDDWRDRVGFRTIETDGEKLLLNGKPVFLMGFNRHEDHPDYGCAIPYEMIWKDIMLFRDMGANALRTCHYPNDERMLDLCDELGILVWEENHARGLFEPGMMEHPKFREQCEAVNREMVTEHFNHPSIVLWGILNECGSHYEFGRSCYAEQFEQIKEMDLSRPTTFASFRYGDDICQDLPDVAGWNRYSGWYANVDVAEDLEDLIAKNEARGMKGKPLIMSEFGGGAIPGFHDPVRRGKWSEERQADILDIQLNVYLNHPRNSGVFVWQFCDCRVDEDRAISRPRTMNNKGIVDEFRRPKVAYTTVKEHFHTKAQGLTYGE